MYKLAWATHLAKDYGATEFLIPKYSDPLHPQFYNNQELMEAEEVLNEFLVFPNDNRQLSIYFCVMGALNQDQNIQIPMIKKVYQAYNDKPEPGLPDPYIGGRWAKDNSFPHPRVPLYKEIHKKDDEKECEALFTIDTHNFSMETYKQRYGGGEEMSEKRNTKPLMDVSTCVNNQAKGLLSHWRNVGRGIQFQKAKKRQNSQESNFWTYA